MLRAEQNTSLESFLTLPQAAALTLYSADYLRLRVNQGKLKAVKRGNSWFTTREWLQEYLGRHTSKLGDGAQANLSLPQAAAFTSYSADYLRLRVNQGKLKAVKRGATWFTTREWLQEYLGSHSSQSVANTENLVARNKERGTISEERVANNEERGTSSDTANNEERGTSSELLPQAPSLASLLEDWIAAVADSLDTTFDRLDTVVNAGGFFVVHNPKLATVVAGVIVTVLFAQSAWAAPYLQSLDQVSSTTGQALTRLTQGPNQQLLALEHKLGSHLVKLSQPYQVALGNLSQQWGDDLFTVVQPVNRRLLPYQLALGRATSPLVTEVVQQYKAAYTLARTNIESGYNVLPASDKKFLAASGNTPSLEHLSTGALEHLSTGAIEQRLPSSELRGHPTGGHPQGETNPRVLGVTTASYPKIVPAFTVSGKLDANTVTARTITATNASLTNLTTNVLTAVAQANLPGGFMAGQGDWELSYSTATGVLDTPIFQARQAIVTGDLTVRGKLDLIGSLTLDNIDNLNVTGQGVFNEVAASKVTTSRLVTNSLELTGTLIAQNLGISGLVGAKNLSGQYLDVSRDVTLGSTANDRLTINAVSTYNAPLSITGSAGLNVGTGATTLGGTLAVTGTSTFTGAITAQSDLTVQGQGMFTRAPTLPHTFAIWATGVADADATDAALYINPASATPDSNLLALAVNGSPKLLVDAEGDIYAHNVVLEGSTASALSTIGTLNVTDNTVLGDTSTDTVTSNAAAWTFANDTNVALTGGVNGLSFDTDTLSIDSTNHRVGIGTTSPNNTFQVANLINFNDSLTSTFIGTQAGVGNTTIWGDNTAIGYHAAKNSGASGIGNANTVVGTEALSNSTTTVFFNTAVGYRALYLDTTGNLNTAYGVRALENNLTGSQNIAIGKDALRNSTGGNNLSLGFQAGDNLTAGNNNLIIGYDVDFPSSTGNNQLNIGNLIFGTGIDGTGTTLSTGNVGIGTTGPGYKLDVNGVINSNNSFRIDNTPYGVATFDGAGLSTTRSDGLYLQYNKAIGNINIQPAAGVTAKITFGDVNGQDVDLYRNAANVLRTGDTFIVDGNVGIGTTAPTANLQVAQGTAGVGTVTTNGTTSVIGVGTQFLNTFKVGDTITVSGETRTIATIVSNTSLTTDTWTGSFAGAVYTLVGGTRFSVLGNGNVGIGTTGPGARLDVRGDGSTLTIAQVLSGNDSVGGRISVGRSSVSAMFGVSPGSSTFTLGDVAGDLVIRNLANNILFSTDGGATTQMYLKNGGNVGIGTTNPLSLLQISSATATALGNYLKVGRTGGGGGGAIQFFGTSVNALVGLDNNGSLTLGTLSSYPIVFSTNATNDGNTLTNERMRITSDGNVGLGTPSPSYRLDALNATTSQTAFNRVANISNAGATFNTTAGALTSYGGYFSSTSTRSAGGSNLTNVGLYATAAGAQANYAAIFENGNVGLGTTTPAVKLQVMGGDFGLESTKRFGSGVNFGTPTSAADGYINFYSGTDGSMTLTTTYAGSAAGGMNFQTGGTTTNMRIDKTGNVGIGTTGPTQKLSVYGGSLDVFDSGTLGSELSPAIAAADWSVLWSTVTSETYGGGGANIIYTVSVGGYWGVDSGKIQLEQNEYYQVSFNYDVDGAYPSALTFGFLADGVLSWVNGFSDIGNAKIFPGTGGITTTYTFVGKWTGATQYIRPAFTNDGGSPQATNFQLNSFSIKKVIGGNVKIAGQLLGIGGTSGLKVTSAGNVGIGEINPTTGKLVINQTDAANLEAIYINTEESTTTQSVFSIETDTANGSGVDTLKFKITADGSVYSEANVYSTPADVAEMYYAADNVEAGDVVEIMVPSVPLPAEADAAEAYAVQHTSTPMSERLLGVVSTKPGPVIGYDWKNPEKLQKQRPVALAGRVPVKVNLENGPIKIGDYLTSSSTPGVAMRAIKAGKVVGVALEEFTEILEHSNTRALEQRGTSSEERGTSGETANNDSRVARNEERVAKIMVFIQTQYWVGSAEVGEQLAQELNLPGLTPATKATAMGGNLVIQDTVWAGRILVRDLVVQSNFTVNGDARVAGKFEVGKAEQPTGITLYDLQTKQPYCVSIIGGELTKTAGVCGTMPVQAPVTSPSTSAPVASTTSEPAPAPTTEAPATEPAPSNSTEPAPSDSTGTTTTPTTEPAPTGFTAPSADSPTVIAPIIGPEPAPATEPAPAPTAEAPAPAPAS